ncbi:hypothetical protein Vadar_000105 [Vaccinium darrowii]|uniref:Uncharacterized protein n=1 Tax=Vaccinium darrowii TaxID=229202 RepID=A0ACB7X6I0_9ERIC|nr:hypothetical protein Vadar_000105 [Vaccinium darrowii]
MVNSSAQSVHGTTSNISLKVGNWNGQVDLMVYPLYDCELILGNEFFLVAKVTVMPHLGGILIADEKQPYFVPRHSKDKRIREGTGGWLSGIQEQKGLRKGEATYLAALVEIKPDVLVEVPDEVAGLLKEFSDVMPLELLKSLPLTCATDHKIGIWENAKTDAEYQQLVKKVKEGIVRRYWLEDGLLHAKGDWLYVPVLGGLRQVLLRETHDPQWARHPGRHLLAGVSTSPVIEYPRMVAREGPRNIVAWMHEVAANLWDKTIRNSAKALSWGGTQIWLRHG